MAKSELLFEACFRTKDGQLAIQMRHPKKPGNSVTVYGKDVDGKLRISTGFTASEADIDAAVLWYQRHVITVDGKERYEVGNNPAK